MPVKALYNNFLAAVAVARYLGVSWSKIIEKVAHLSLPNMRFQIVKKQGVTFINDAYNANPDSMNAALESLPKPDPDCKTVAVLGEMLELGMYTHQGHAAVAETALEACGCIIVSRSELPNNERNLAKRTRRRTF